jgi:hypothetical protein
MSVDPALLAAFRRFEHRAIGVAFVRALSTGLLVSLLAVEAAALLGVSAVTAAATFIALTLIAAAAYALTTRPATLALARRLDERAGLKDLLVTAIDGRVSEMHAVVRQAGLSALAKESPARAYPIELPRQWRRWLVVAGLAQVIALPLVVRSPAGRAPQTGLTSLPLPSARGGPSSSAPRVEQRSRSEYPTADAAQAGAGSKASTEARPGPAVATDRAGAGGSAAAADAGRLRLAAANADAEIASGRVPLARRGIVERYFANIQSQRKRPR